MMTPYCLFHPLPAQVDVPTMLNDPFDYVPDEVSLLAWEELRSYVFQREDWKKEVAEGKMFGVLVVRDQAGQLGYLAAYSGQIGGRSDWEGFVPAIYDYLQPDGYFKTEEHEISLLTEQYKQETAQFHSSTAYNRYAQLQQEADDVLKKQSSDVRIAKKQRDMRRQEGYISAPERQDMIRESQYMKAELRRTKQHYDALIKDAYAPIAAFQAKMDALLEERRRRSEALQDWLFSQFVVVDNCGRMCDLLSLFNDTRRIKPPSGSGECCEPKLLQYAFTHQLQPLSMAMFWCCDQPHDDMRQNEQYYMACRGKCKPILDWMLAGMELRKGPVASRFWEGQLEVVYEDDYLCVVNKPAGLLSVSGLTDMPSVERLLGEQWHNRIIPYMVHRLDMDTSGLLVVAKDMDTYVSLQQSFANRQVKKQYMAVLEHEVSIGSGEIRLPLRPDVFNRPYQVVDKEGGKEAITRYEVIDGRNVLLTPLTGRTHQLRVHCAHSEGLGSAIKGDPLYGHRADRLWLHAMLLEFHHPITGQLLRLECKGW